MHRQMAQARMKASLKLTVGPVPVHKHFFVELRTTSAAPMIAQLSQSSITSSTSLRQNNMSLAPENPSIEPLLRSRSPPRHAFRFRNDAASVRTSSPTNLNIGVTTPEPRPPAGASRVAGPETASHRFLLQQFLGRTYGTNYKIYIWIILQAVCVGFAAVLVLGLVTLSQNLWLDLNYSFMPPTKGQFNWMYVTGMGGFMAGLFLLIPGAPAVNGYDSFTRMLVKLEANSSESIPMLLASCVVLSCGAPLGPEVALVAVASCISSFLASWIHNARSKAILLLTSLSAVFGSILGPFIPLVLVHELAVTGRPDKLTIDSVIAEQVLEDEAEGRRTGIALQPHTHDHLESLTLQLVSSLIVAWITRSIAPTLAPMIDFSQSDKRDTEFWHYGVAVLLGLLCGMVGLCILTLYALVCTVRRKSCKWLRRRGIPLWATLLLFTTLAGILHGLLAVWCPYSSTMGLQLIQGSWEAAQNRESLLNARDFCFTAIARSVGLAVTLGCGFLGGMIIPLFVIGGCIGFSLVVSIHWLPMSLVVPCCLAACPVSLCPIPLTATIGVALMLGCSMEQSTAILIACLSSWMLTGGDGVVRSVAEWTIGLEGALVDDDSFLDEPSDDDIIRNVRETIFGEP
ncbi:hypothetical protein MPSEU_000399700 [Mayamaea pseudoterrestris]|nr:hypothetical protein MPSEU_000399700 [Mayamaea pseudoterrestris]